MAGLHRARASAAAVLLAGLAAGLIATSRIHPNSRGAGETRAANLGTGVEVGYRRVGIRSVQAAYLEAIGSTEGSRSRASGCALGSADERAWSRPARPRHVVGRFACRVEHGRAAMWWSDTDRGVLAHAVAADDDLDSLFAWWLSHSER